MKKLNTLKEFKPAADWKTSSRELLSAQVSNASGDNVKITFVDELAFELKNFFSVFAQPAFAVIGLFVLLSGGALGVNAARNTRPGDSLYAARIWGEKARVAVTIDRNAKAKLEMKLASARAKEITAVLSDPSFNNQDNIKKVEKLSEDFKSEINTVKEKYVEISKMNEIRVAVNPVLGVTSSNPEADDVAIGIGAAKVANDDGKVFAVDSGKATSGIQISQPALTVEKPSAVGVGKSLISAPTSTMTISTSSAPVSTSTANDLNKNLSEAEASFDAHDFAGAKNILEQFDDIIKNIDNGEVKGVSESATSAPASIGSSSKENK